MTFEIQKNSRRSILMAAALMCSVLPFSVGAQNWPDKPIKIIVPAPGGSAVEVMARVLSDKDSGFERFWAVYPLKKAKAAAEKNWIKAIKKTDPEIIIAAAAK